MIPDLDIYRSANVLVKQHGEDAPIRVAIYRTADALVKRHGQDAPIHAAMRADAMLEAGDLNGYAVFKRILRAIESLQGTAPKSGEEVH